MMSCLPKISEMNDLLLAPRSSRRRFALIDSVSRVNNQTQYRRNTFMISSNGLNYGQLIFYGLSLDMIRYEMYSRFEWCCWLYESHSFKMLGTELFCQNNYVGDFITSQRWRHKLPPSSVTNVYVTSGPLQQRTVGPVLEFRTLWPVWLIL